MFRSRLRKNRFIVRIFYYNAKSSLLRYSLKEMYESLVDTSVIDRFEETEAEPTINFLSAEDILNGH